MGHIKSKLNLFFKYQIGKYFLILFIIFGNVSVFTSPKKGQCIGECENGKGKFIFEKSLDQYEGNFLDGKFHGYGILKIYKGKNKKVKIFDIYEGMFSFDQMEGEGIYKYANGDTISGIFSKNKLNGIGTARNGYIDKNYGYIYSGTFTATGSMALGRGQHSAVAYATGKVLVSGGFNINSILKNCEMYDISTQKFVSTDSMSLQRYNHFMIQLTDGKILAFGNTL